MASNDLPSHPTYNHSNPLLDPSTTSIGEDHQDSDGEEVEGLEGNAAAQVRLLDVPLVERGIALSQDTISAPETTTDVPEAPDLHTYSGFEPPKRQSARRTRNILPEALQGLENGTVPQDPPQRRNADHQNEGVGHEVEQHRSKRARTEYGADDGVKKEEAEERALIENEEEEAPDTTDGDEDSPLSEPSTSLGPDESDGEGYEPDWFSHFAREGGEHSRGDKSGNPTAQSSPLYRLHMQSRSFEDQTAMREDIRRINMYNQGVKENYTIVDRLGEGTFSSVYKAIDKNYARHDNRYWQIGNAIVPNDTASRKQLEKEAEDNNLEARLRTTFNQYASSVGASAIKQKDDGNGGEVWVALKRIYVTSSPDRIFNELDIMEDLRACRNVAQLITAFRDEDQVIISMPYQPNDDFRLFFRHLDPPNIRKYMRCLFRALNDCHRRGIIHRDVKPANFLFDYETGNGVLVDFGLAERYYPPSKVTCLHAAATYLKPHGYRLAPNQTDMAKIDQAMYDAKKRMSAGRVGVRKEDVRPAARANRAGTRGFRAPEVLLKCPDQTVAIDVWAAGIILLSILCQKFPVFVSGDDMEALLEIGCIFGQTQLEKTAQLHSRIVSTTVPCFTNSPNSLAELVCKLNPKIWEPPSIRATPAEAKSHIRAIDSALDLLKRLLIMDPTRRYTSHQALMHPFLKDDLPKEEQEKEEVLHAPGEGACKAFHWVNEEGIHYAMVERRPRIMQWGQGMAVGDEPCPYHAGGIRPYMGSAEPEFIWNKPSLGATASQTKV